MDRAPGQTTTISQSFDVTAPGSATLTFDAVTRPGDGDLGTDGFTVEVLDASNNVIATETIIPESDTTWETFTLDVDFPTSDTYTLRFTEVGDDDGNGALLDNVQFVDASGADSIDGGAGDDSLTGGAGDDVFVYAASDGSDTITDFNTGNSGTLEDGDSTNNDFIDLGSYYDYMSELYADHADDGVLNQSNSTDNGGDVDYSDNSRFAEDEGITFTGASADNSSFTTENTGVTCFTSGTAILTPGGDVLIDELCVGDLVVTADNGPQPIRWIGKKSWTRWPCLLPPTCALG